MNRNFKQGMIQQYNLNIEHQMPGNIVLTAGYAGSHSTHILVGQSNENIGSPSACGTSRLHVGCGASRSFPTLGPFQRSSQQQRRNGPLRLSADQGGDQEYEAWPLCSARLHLVANIRFRHAGRLGYESRRDILATAWDPEAGLGFVAVESERQLYREHPL